MEGYTTKEVLLATKNKLAQLEEKLNKLKEMTYIAGDKNIKDIRYDILNLDNDEKPELRCHVYWNDKRLKGKIKNLKVKYNLYIYGPENGKVVRDNNGNSYILNDNYHMFIPCEKQEEFRQVSDEILSDEFTNEFLKGHWFYPRTNSKNQSMNLFPDIVMISGNNNYQDYFTWFNFFPIKNSARLRVEKKGELSDEMLYELLNIELDDSYFSDYRKKFIESSKERNKEIIIPKFNTKNSEVDFDIKEDEKRLYLIKK